MEQSTLVKRLLSISGSFACFGTESCDSVRQEPYASLQMRTSLPPSSNIFRPSLGYLSLTACDH